MTEIRDYDDYSDEKLRAAFELFSSPTLDALGDVDVNGITVDSDMRAAILAEAHSRALKMNARRAEPTGRPFDYLTDHGLFDTIERVLSLPIGGQLLAAEWLTALKDEAHTRALVLHERAMSVTYQCLGCGQDVAILDQPTHEDTVHADDLVEDIHNNVGRYCSVRGDASGRDWRVQNAIKGNRYIVNNILTLENRVVAHAELTNLY
jgi:hypothetical protein